MNKPLRLYFLCVQNRCRSQIAEAFANHYGGEDVLAESAGIESSSVHPLTIQVMKEAGIDISANVSKTIDMKTFMNADMVVKTCQTVHERCPVVPFGIRSVQWEIPDPVPKDGSAGNIEDFRRTPGSDPG